MARYPLQPRMMLREIDGNRMREYIIPCDDATGGVLHILIAPDGDIHFSMSYDQRQNNADDLSEVFDSAALGLLSHANVRVRSGIGGGSNSDFWLAMSKALKSLKLKPSNVEAQPDAK